ncbi:hypothetical protein [Myxococcus landrumensis]|uniref:Lipoprotein n=1 Tax=Myxococcus landrumensis TaxID=2813577 RepID=A0ABX7N2V2_9BACT|nr:hypothetical protein [Myxococcus landrumus]QSQ11995.1 hypothetical protein JY572_26875 [Myxococcus landrumus]
MRKAIAVASVLSVAGWWACAARTPVSPEAQALQSHKVQAGDDDCGCAADPCPDDGGTNCLDIAVNPSDAGKKRFSPGCNSHGWSMCSGQQLFISSEMSETLCIDLSSVGGTEDGGSGVRSSLSSGSTWTVPSLTPGEYNLSVCNQHNGGCSEGCQNALSPDQTIRGNLDIVVKDPDPSSTR